MEEAEDSTATEDTPQPEGCENTFMIVSLSPSLDYSHSIRVLAINS